VVILGATSGVSLATAPALTMVNEARAQLVLPVSPMDEDREFGSKRRSARRARGA
jgi:hypothetical protein